MKMNVIAKDESSARSQAIINFTELTGKAGTVMNGDIRRLGVANA